MSRARVCVVAIILLAAGGRAEADEVKWRTNYDAARKEAVETGRPLLFDFGTEQCFWCKKLDATTFRDPKVVKLLNDRFIPVKIDGNKYARLVEALQIESYPTLVLATADGKVIDRHEGYADVAQLTAFLNKAPAPAAPKPVAVAGAPKQPPSKAEIDAGLAALFPEIAAALER